MHDTQVAGSQATPDGNLPPRWEVAAHVVRRTMESCEGDGGGPLSESTRSCVRYVREHFAEPITVEQLAEASGLSKFHLIRKFRSEVGLSPGAFLQRFRIVQAMDHLSRTDRAVQDVGRHVGYRDPAAFSRAFLRVAGMQPGIFRRRRKEAGAKE